MWLWLAACGGGEGTTDKGGDDCRAEIPYDGVDQDCDGEDLRDVDGDGVPYPDDCRDDDADQHPGAEEVAYDGVDQDCADGDLVDVDGDGDPAEVAGGDDCDDGDDRVHASARDDVGDDLDQDCDGTDGRDRDGDGAADRESGGNDCDDRDPERSPLLEERWYDGVDADCGGECDYDQDGDGAVFPGTEVADGDACDQEPGRGAFAEEDCADTNPDLVRIDLTSRSPRPGALDVPTYTAVAAYLTEGDPDAAIAVLANGVPVPGVITHDNDDTIVFFTPDAPLAAETVHQVTLVYACGGASWSFTTAPEGGGGEITGSWSFDLGSGSFVAPPGIAPLVPVLGLSPLRLDLASSDGVTADLRFGGGDPQDTCVVTADVRGADYVAPELVLEGATFDLGVSGYSTPLTDARIEAELLEASGTLAMLSSVLDTRPLVDLLAPGGAPDAVCALISTFGVACDPCPDGEPVCLSLRVEDVPGVIAADPLRVVTPADVAADPTCP